MFLFCADNEKLQAFGWKTLRGDEFPSPLIVKMGFACPVCVQTQDTVCSRSSCYSVTAET